MTSPDNELQPLLSLSGSKLRHGEEQRNLKGALFIVVGYSMFAGLAACVKWLESVENLPTSAIVWAQSSVQTLFAIAAICYIKPPKHQLPDLRLTMWLLFRAVLYFVFDIVWFNTLKVLQSGDATAIVYVSPMFAGVLSFFFLGEALERSFFVFFLLNMTGVMLVAQPSFLGFGHHTDLSPFAMSADVQTALPKAGVFLGISAALIAASMGPLLRKTRAVHFLVVDLFSYGLTATVFGPLFYLYEGKPELSIGNFPQTLMLGGLIVFFGFFGRCFQTNGYQMGEVSKMALFEYIEIPESYIFQILVFDHVPNRYGICGALIILTSSIANAALGVMKSDHCPCKRIAYCPCGRKQLGTLGDADLELPETALFPKCAWRSNIWERLARACSTKAYRSIPDMVHDGGIVDTDLSCYGSTFSEKGNYISRLASQEVEENDIEWGDKHLQFTCPPSLRSEAEAQEEENGVSPAASARPTVRTSLCAA